MRKAIVFIFFTVLSAAVFSLGVFSQQAVMNLEGGAFGDVPFPHQTHQKAVGNCDLCHKLFPKEKGSIQKYILENKLKKKQAMDQCVVCHRENASAGRKSGPIKCKECHKK